MIALEVLLFQKERPAASKEHRSRYEVDNRHHRHLVRYPSLEGVITLWLYAVLAR